MIPTVAWNELDSTSRDRLMARPLVEAGKTLCSQVADILEEVRTGGDPALAKLTRRFDRCPPDHLRVPPGQLAAAAASLPRDLLTALDRAIDTVTAFHDAGTPADVRVETAPGVVCESRWLPLNPVGLYVPAGTAPLPSTAIMLGVPARLAGCPRRIMATPPGEDGCGDPAVLAVAHRLGIEEVFLAGGAQAIAAMAFGTETVPACVKIFGPGNRFVTEAKRQVAARPGGTAVDLPAGPSEVLIIADDSANPDFVAVDLLSQAEHGPDSQVFLVTCSPALARAVVAALQSRLQDLPRREIAKLALASGACIVVRDLAEAIAVSEQYAPEHLIIATEDPDPVSRRITTAGSVFLGHYTPESLGDYVSGTNHVLPTDGWARSSSGVSVTDFMRRMTVQEASPGGLQNLGPVAARLAAHEGLEAHRLAVTIRLDRLAGGTGPGDT